MAKHIKYKASVLRDLKLLGRAEAEKLLDAVERKLRQDPPPSKSLSGEFKGLSRVRIGDYRAIYTRTIEGYLVLRIAHRKEVYKKNI